MSSNFNFQIEVGVGIKTLWKAMSKDVIGHLDKSAHLITGAKIVEGDGGHGTLISVDIGPTAPHIPPFKEKIVLFDETNYAIAYQVVKGGFLDIGFSSFKISFKFDGLGLDKTLIKSKLTYELEEGIDGTKALEELASFIKNFMKHMASNIQKPTI